MATASPMARSGSPQSETADGASFHTAQSQLYEALNPERKEIRVLRIDNEPCRELVHCHLEIVSLEDYKSEFRSFMQDYSLSSVRDFTDLNDAWVRHCLSTVCLNDEHRDCEHIRVPCWRSWPSGLEWWEMRLAFKTSHQLRDPLETENFKAPIRLVSTVPGSRKQDVCLKPRFSWGDYEALSYCWESDAKESLLVLNGQPIQVSRNLEAALQQMRHLPEVRTGMRIWCDALCIDQDGDTVEKNHQVSLMKDIYRNAFSVVAWLGPETAESASAFDTMTCLYRAWAADLRYEQVEEWLSRLAWRNVRSLFCRNYWQRLWIIQELMLNRHMSLFLCGRRQIPRNVVLTTAAYGRSNSRSDLGSRVEMTSNSVTLASSSQLEEYAIYDHIVAVTSYKDYRPSDVIHLGSKAKCKDPRDKIYGLLGLLPSEISHDIIPDYQIDVNDLYIDFARRFGSLMGRTNLLSWKASEAHSKLELPSWVPDWTGKFPRKHIQWLMKRKAAMNTAGPEIDIGCSNVSENRRLHCQAIRVDRIHACSLALDELPTHAAGIPVVPKPFSREENPSTCWPGTSQGLSAGLALQRVLLMDHPYHQPEYDIHFEQPAQICNIAWVDQSPSNHGHSQAIDHERPTWGLTMEDIKTHRHWPAFEGFRQHNASFMIHGRALQDFFRAEADRVPISEQEVGNMERIVLALHGRRLVTTSEKDLLGLVPESARSGDIIAVLRDCNFPVVLRPADSSPVTESTTHPCYEYIGECYIDEMMDGQAFDAGQQAVDIYLV